MIGVEVPTPAQSVKASPRRARRRAGEGPAIDRRQLVAALVDLARSEGIAALNMRRVASRLGVSARLLYRHIRDKQDMIDLLTDEIIGQAGIDLSSGTWDERLRRVHDGMRASYEAFPGAAAEIMTRVLQPGTPSHAGAIRDGVFAIFEDAGLGRGESELALVQFSILALGGLVVEENIRSGSDLILPAEQIARATAQGVEILIADIARRGTR